VVLCSGVCSCICVCLLTDRVEIGLVYWSVQLCVFDDKQGGNRFCVVECAVVCVW
jgi:hypothetical protein